MFTDILLDDSYEGNLRKEGRSVRIVVTISSGPNATKVSGCRCYIISLFLELQPLESYLFRLLLL